MHPQHKQHAETKSLTTTLGDVAGDQLMQAIVAKTEQPAAAPVEETKRRPSMEEKGILDPENGAAIRKLVEKMGSQAAVAPLLGLSPSHISNMLLGGTDVRITYSKLAQYILDEMDAEENPKAVSLADQQVSVVVIGKEHSDLLRRAVTGLGGTISPLSFAGGNINV